MRLGNLLDQETVASLYAIAKAPWHKRPEQERMLAVAAHCQNHATKIGQFIGKKGRMACTEIPHGRRFLTGQVEARAVAITHEKPYMDENKSLKQGLYDVLREYGYARPFKHFSAAFDQFQVR